MNAKNVYLTHFSCRYPKMPHRGHNSQPLQSRDQDSLCGEVTPVVALAFDHVSVRIGDMWKLGLYRSAIEQNYADTEQLDAEAETPAVADAEILDAAMDS
jgi:ribonuclease Z